MTRLARLGVSTGGLVVGAGAFGAVLHALNVSATGSAVGTNFWLLGLVGALAFGSGGGVLTRERPALSVGWLLLAVGASQGLSVLCREWGVYALEVRPGLPFGEPAYWVSNWVWLPGNLALITVLPLVLPDGRLPSRRWLPALAVAVTAISLETLAWALAPYDQLDAEAAVAGVANPVASTHAQTLTAIATPLFVIAFALAVTSMVVRWRHAAREERARLAWVLWGSGVTVALLVVSQLLGRAGYGVTWLPALAFVPLPAACVVAVLRYQLWNIHVVVSHSLLYATLSTVVVGVYLATVGVLGGIAGRSTGAPVVATALVALFVLPLHRRLQRLVNRLVHGDVEDPYAALARVGRRLEDAAGPEEIATRVLPEVVRDVARALRLSYAAIALRDGQLIETGAVTTEVTELPLTYGGVQVGRLLVGRGADSLSAGERRLLADLARQAAAVVHGVLLTRDAQRSREQLVEAREEERRRLRRELHDGLGPALAAVALQAETARDLVGDDPGKAVGLLDRLVPRLNDAVGDVRAVVHGLRPPTLDDLGLRGALDELAARFATPSRSVRVEADELGELPAAVDVAVYRIVAEALTNAVRHGAATEVTIRLRREDGGVRVSIVDDGCGVQPGVRHGVGLRSMRERAEELGGTCTVAPVPAQRGTVVSALLPVGIR